MTTKTTLMNVLAHAVVVIMVTAEMSSQEAAVMEVQATPELNGVRGSWCPSRCTA